MEGDGAVVIAETVKMDTGTVFLILLVVLGSIALTAVVIGLVGTAIGIALGRLSLSPDVKRSLPRGSRIGLVLGAVASPILSWVLLWIVASSLWTNSSGNVAIFLAPFPLPIAWGWWNGKRYRFGDAPGPPPPPAPPERSE